MPDEVARYNIERWEALVQAHALFTRPSLKFSVKDARDCVDPDGRLGELSGKSVLCLASGGGKQAPAFALLGANVTSADLSSGQLRRDEAAAKHYGVQIRTQQADMRDLSMFGAVEFDIVWQPYSINFVPDCRQVFAQVARVLRPGGIYYVVCANPFFAGIGTRDARGAGYLVHRRYIQGEEITYTDEDWVYDQAKQPGGKPIQGPREYRQTLSTFVNGLIAAGFAITHISDCTDLEPDLNAAPGTWGHFASVAPPWLAIWTLRNA
jgi:SAM-dependent methyltransferase